VLKVPLNSNQSINQSISAHYAGTSSLTQLTAWHSPLSRLAQTGALVTLRKEIEEGHLLRNPVLPRLSPRLNNHNNRPIHHHCPRPREDLVTDAEYIYIALCQLPLRYSANISLYVIGGSGVCNFCNVQSAADLSTRLDSTANESKVRTQNTLQFFPHYRVQLTKLNDT